jgi:ABC-2 type transport system ATP-binding protein
MPESGEPAAAVEITGLEKVYDGGKHALRGVDLMIPRGSMFGLLGPNGAGKSTLINILAGLVRKSSGRVQIWGIDIDEAPRAARAAIGIMPQEIALDPFFPARSALELQAGLFGIPKAERRTDELLSVLGLADKADAPARSLSGGMRRRLMVAKALVHSPPILVLDEPTAGVDVGLRQQLWDYVRDLNRNGTTVLLTTHYIQEAETLCDRIAILMDGEILVSDTTEALLNRVEDRELTIELASPLPEVPGALRPFGPVLVRPDQLVFRYAHGSDAADQILGAIHDAGLHVREITTERPDLESMFLDVLRRG